MSSLTSAKALYQRWQELAEISGSGDTEEFDWTTKELRTNLKGIEWDLQDLDETVAIVEKTPQRFNVWPRRVYPLRRGPCLSVSVSWCVTDYSR